MAKIRRLFSYKCEKGHAMSKWFPLGTRVSDHDETTCAECLKINEVRPAYVVFAEAKAEDRSNGRWHV